MNFRTALAWAASGSLVQSLIRFLSTILIARLLLPEEVGIYALAMSAAALLGALHELGTGTFLVQKRELEAHHVQSVYAVLAFLAALAAGLCLLGAPWIASFYEEPAIAGILGIVAVNFLFWPVAEPARALLLRDQRFDLLEQAAVASTATGAVASVGLAWAGLGPAALAIGLLVRSATSSAMLLSWKRDHLRRRPSLRDAREVLTFGGFLSAASLCNRGGMQGRKLILGAGIGLDAVGWMDRALSLPVTIQRAIFGPLNHVLLPKYAQLVDEGRDISAPYLKVVACGAAIAWPVYFSMALVATPIVVVLFGESWRGAGTLLTYLLAARALFVAVPSLDQVLVAHGKVRRLFAHRFTMLVVSLAVYVFAVRFGVPGFGVAIVAMAALRQALALLCLRFTGIHAMRIARTVAPVFPVVALTGAPMLMLLLLGDGEPGILELAGTSLGCGLGWLVGVHWAGPRLPDEVELARRSLIGQLRRRWPY